MSYGMEPWAIVLAGGDGVRLRALTRHLGGRSIPKQYCSLDGGPTLFEEALQRARRIAGRDRILSVVAAQHRDLREPICRTSTGETLARNVAVQPRNAEWKMASSHTVRQGRRDLREERRA